MVWATSMKYAYRDKMCPCPSFSPLRPVWNVDAMTPTGAIILDHEVKATSSRIKQNLAPWWSYHACPSLPLYLHLCERKINFLLTLDTHVFFSLSLAAKPNLNFYTLKYSLMHLSFRYESYRCASVFVIYPLLLKTMLGPKEKREMH